MSGTGGGRDPGDLAGALPEAPAARARGRARVHQGPLRPGVRQRAVPVPSAGSGGGAGCRAGDRCSSPAGATSFRRRGALVRHGRRGALGARTPSHQPSRALVDRLRPAVAGRDRPAAGFDSHDHRRPLRVGHPSPRSVRAHAAGGADRRAGSLSRGDRLAAGRAPPCSRARSMAGDSPCQPARERRSPPWCQRSTLRSLPVALPLRSAHEIVGSSCLRKTSQATTDAHRT